MLLVPPLPICICRRREERPSVMVAGGEGKKVVSLFYHSFLNSSLTNWSHSKEENIQPTWFPLNFKLDNKFNQKEHVCGLTGDHLPGLNCLSDEQVHPPWHHQHCHNLDLNFRHPRHYDDVLYRHCHVQILPILLHMDADSLLNCGRSQSHQNSILHFRLTLHE